MNLCCARPSGEGDDELPFLPRRTGSCQSAGDFRGFEPVAGGWLVSGREKRALATYG